MVYRGIVGVKSGGFDELGLHHAEWTEEDKQDCICEIESYEDDDWDHWTSSI